MTSRLGPFSVADSAAWATWTKTRPSATKSVICHDKSSRQAGKQDGRGRAIDDRRKHRLHGIGGAPGLVGDDVEQAPRVLLEEERIADTQELIGERASNGMARLPVDEAVSTVFAKASTFFTKMSARTAGAITSSLSLLSSPDPTCWKIAETPLRPAASSLPAMMPSIGMMRPIPAPSSAALASPRMTTSGSAARAPRPAAPGRESVRASPPFWGEVLKEVVARGWGGSREEIIRETMLEIECLRKRASGAV
ncbi:hypothetical protein SAMCCGM7_pC0190 (plasmid) [Sinorhizobium americanum CCGM7]|nr:hypothetical protein SAMCCGM7_pC0190 [Sinorhizobium americanum CCGM7]